MANRSRGQKVAMVTFRGRRVGNIRRRDRLGPVFLGRSKRAVLKYVIKRSAFVVVRKLINVTYMFDAYIRKCK